MKTSSRSFLGIAVAAMLAVSGVLLPNVSTTANAQISTVPISAIPQNGRIAIAGDSITELMLYTKYVEIYLRACAGRSDVSCFQYGWGGENAAQLVNRIQRGDMDCFVPNVVTFLYGANDVGSEVWDPSWMPTMWSGRMTGIVSEVNSKYPGAIPVIVGPTYFDQHSPNANPSALAVSNTDFTYMRAISQGIVAASSNPTVYFSDAYERMLTSGTAAQAALGTSYYFGGSDGVHGGPNGQLMIAHEILKALNVSGTIASITVDMNGSASVSSGHVLVSSTINSSNAALTINSSQYPFCPNYDSSTAVDRMATILPYLPFNSQLNQFTLTVKNMSQPYANVTWGSITLTFSQAALAAGVNLAAQFAHTPFDSQFATVMGLITNKELQEESMIKAAGSATAPTTGWTAADVTTWTAMNQAVANAITPVQHTIIITPTGGTSAPQITGVTSTSGTAGNAFSFQVSATNNPTSYSASNLPDGLSMNVQSGLISGTPTAAGTNVVALAASNAYGTGTGSLTLVVYNAVPAPVITSALTATGTVNSAFSYQITATNSPTKYYATGLPAGLGLNASTGTITGTPSTAASTNVLISGGNAGGNGQSVTLVITVNAAGDSTNIIGTSFVSGGSWQPLAGTQIGLATNLPGGYWAQAGGLAGVNVQLTPTWYPPTNSVYMGDEMAGLAIPLSSMGGYVKPTQITISADINPACDEVNFHYGGAGVGFWSVVPTPVVVMNGQTGFTGLLLKPNQDGNGAETNGTLQVIANGAASGSAVDLGYQLYPWNFYRVAYTINTATGAISNVSINGTGVNGLSSNAFTDAATAYAGVFAAVSGRTDLQNFSVTGAGGGLAPSITSASTASGVINSAFSYQITATNSPTSFNATGLPAGLSVNTGSGAITGSPTAVGTSTVTLSAINAFGTGTATLTLTVNATGSAPVITSGSTANGTQNSAFSYQITASNSPTSFNATGLPSGLSVNTSSGVISGTPAAVGASMVSLSAINAFGTGTAALNLIVGPAAARVVIQDDFSQANADTGNGTPYNVYGVHVWDGAPGGGGLPPNNGTTPGNTVLGTDLPGGVWQFGGGYGSDFDAVEIGNLSGYGASALSITGSSGDVPYVSLHNYENVAITLNNTQNNTALTVSVYVLPNGANAYVGFDSTIPGTNNTNFTGLMVDTAGGISLIVNGAQVGSTIGYTGSFPTTTASKLTFTVNTSTGAIFGISFQGSSSNYSFSTTAFTNSACSYLALYCPAGNRNAEFAYLNVTSSSAPAPPTNLAATAGNNQVVLNWTASSGATNYSIYRGTSSGGESATAIGTSTSTSYTDSTAVNGATYYYEATASNSSGASGYSNEAGATLSSSGATTVIYDDFSQANADTGNGTPYNVYGVHVWDGAPGGGGLPPNNGTTPGNTVLGTDLPGGVWQFGGGYGSDFDAVEIGNLPNRGASNLALVGGTGYVPYLALHNNENAAIMLRAYNSNSMLTVSIYVAPSSNPAFVGFDSALNVPNNFSGLEVDTSGGLSLIVNGSQVGSTIAFTGAFTGTTALLLTFSVNTATGAMYNVSLQGSTSAYSFSATTFTSAQTVYLALYSPNNSGGTAQFAKLTVSANPIVTAAPVAPAGLTATSSTGIGQIALNWSASDGAQSYIIERSTTSTGGYTNIGTVAAPTLTYTDADSLLAAGRNYYYEVAAANTNGTSALSASVVATPYVPASYLGWDYTYFGLNAPAGEAGDTASPANDGLPNLLKYALGLNPAIATTSGITTNVSNGVLTMNYTRGSAATDVTVQAMWSTDLQTWSNGDVTQTMLSDNGTLQTWQATVPVNRQIPRMFMRLQVTGP